MAFPTSRIGTVSQGRITQLPGYWTPDYDALDSLAGRTAFLGTGFPNLGRVGLESCALLGQHGCLVRE